MSESDKMDQTSVAMPESLHAAIEDRLGYGDHKAEWIREACRQRLERDRDKQSDCDIALTHD